jgi:DNA-binding transcriptional regulator YhcF (GntR family)
MQQIEIIFREILYQRMELKRNMFTQAQLAASFHVSLSTVNRAIRILADMGAVEIHLRSFSILDVKKVLYYWASIRNLQKDCIYATRVEQPVKEIEKAMPDDIIFGAYSAYKFLFHDVPADYSEVYVYADLETIKKRFPPQKHVPNLFVLKTDDSIQKYGKKTTYAQTFVDLWNIREWYAKEFVTAFEVRFHGILE